MAYAISIRVVSLLHQAKTLTSTMHLHVKFYRLTAVASQVELVP